MSNPLCILQVQRRKRVRKNDYIKRDKAQRHRHCFCQYLFNSVFRGNDVLKMDSKEGEQGLRSLNHSVRAASLPVANGNSCSG